MTQRRKVTIKGIQHTPLNERAFVKLIRHYYRGPYDVIIHFDRRVQCWGTHTFNNRKKIHTIKLSPKWCRNNKSTDQRDFKLKVGAFTLVRMNKYDTVCRIIQVALHELKHAMQCDDNYHAYENFALDRHENITQSGLRYELSPLESEAEGWSLINFNRALDKYDTWCEEADE